MNRIFLCVVAIAALCSACETEDENFAPQTNHSTTALQQAKGMETNDYEIYQSIVKSFVYNSEQTYQENLLRFEEYVNRQMPQYAPKEGAVYEKIDHAQLQLLERAGIDVVAQLTYSPATKQAIYALLENRLNDETLKAIASEDESRLVATLQALYNNEEGDDDNERSDKDVRGKKTIAFAYGAQYNLTQAVLYAGAVELKKK